jgi:phospholipase C
MPTGLDNLKHIVVLMMENRSFDHMLGGLKAQDPRIEGLTGNETNLDSNGQPAKVEPLAAYQGQLDPDPDHHFPGVMLQMFGEDAPTGPTAVPTMSGFVQSYFEQRRDVNHSRRIMYYFAPERLPVLSTLARSYAVFNGWFSSIPGPTPCNRAFAHYGTSFGEIGLNPVIFNPPFQSIYERMLKAGRTAKVYFYDEQSPSLEIINLRKKQGKLFSVYNDFLADCKKNRLPDYAFVEPNYSDHEGDGGAELASDQHPDHHVLAGEAFIASVYNAIRKNANLWKSTLLIIVYDEHGGCYDHVPPPTCIPDGFIASGAATETGKPFAFDRLGPRVPAIAVSPWIPRATVVTGTEDSVAGRVFEHASIPATVQKAFKLVDNNRSPREKAANTFLDLLSDKMRSDNDCPVFK